MYYVVIHSHLWRVAYRLQLPTNMRYDKYLVRVSIIYKFLMVGRHSFIPYKYNKSLQFPYKCDEQELSTPNLMNSSRAFARPSTARLVIETLGYETNVSTNHSSCHFFATFFYNNIFLFLSFSFSQSLVFHSFSRVHTFCTLDYHLKEFFFPLRIQHNKSFACWNRKEKINNFKWQADSFESNSTHSFPPSQSVLICKCLVAAVILMHFTRLHFLRSWFWYFCLLCEDFSVHLLTFFRSYSPLFSSAWWYEFYVHIVTV